MAKGLFLTATGTDVGKTFVSGLLVKKLHQGGCNAGYYKPALSGAILQNGHLIPGDAEYVRTVSGIADTTVSYVYRTAVSPHLAAQLEGNPPELAVIKQDFQKSLDNCEYLTVEGCGGAICPLRYDQQIIMLTDVMQALQLPTLIIAPAALGTINSTVLTIEHLRSKNIPIAGVMLNNFTSDATEVDNKYMIEHLTGVPILACISPDAIDLPMSLEDLTSLYHIPGKELKI